MDQKQQDVIAVIKLYELRRDEALRQARKWFVSEFNPKSAMDIITLFLSGERQSANYRMVTSYWNMAASFVNNGGIDEKIFLDANTEHIAVFSKIEPFLAEIREMANEPDYLYHLETLVMKIPNIKETLEQRRKLFEKWTER